MRAALNGPAMQQWESSSNGYWATTVECYNTEYNFLFAEVSALRITKANSKPTTDPESGQCLIRILYLGCSSNLKLAEWVTYRIVQNSDGEKLWQTWQIWNNLLKFYPLKFIS